jgi:hypothetical protein
VQASDGWLGFCTVTRPTYGIPAFAAACLAAATLAACGGGSSTPEPVAQLSSESDVAQVGSHAISKAMLNEWMTVYLGSDYYEVTKRQVPADLVSEPVNYPACVRKLERTPAVASAGKARPSAEQLKYKCEVLYKAIKEQTLTFLVGAYWDLNFAAKHHLSVSAAAVQKVIEHVETREYPKPGQFEASLKTRRRTLAQERFLAEIDLLQAVLKGELESKSQQYAKLQSEAHSAISDAVCRPEYVVTHCKEPAAIYTGPSLATLVEEIAK